MNRRPIVSFLFSLVVLALLIGLGAAVYDAGIREGLARAAVLPAGTVLPYAYGYGFHGFGFLGLLFPILFLFLIFGLIRAAFGRGRGWGRHGGWGHGYGPGGYGPGGSGGPGGGPDFDSLDKNADGRLTPNELKGTPLAQRFAEIDADNSGQIDRREFDRFLKKQAKSADEKQKSDK